MRLKELIFILSSIILIAPSCKKRQLNRDLSTSETFQRTESFWASVLTTTENSLRSNRLDASGKSDGQFGDCGTISVEPAWPDSTWPKTFTIDFGSENCEGLDGRTRRGRLECTLTGYYREEGTELTIQPDDYYLNDHLIQGKKSVFNQGTNSKGNISYSVVIEDGLITSASGESTTWESTRTREWIKGSTTNYFTDNGNGQWLEEDGITDDVYLITGSGSGLNEEGRGYAVNIIAPLRIQLDCDHITVGVLELTPDELKTRTIDYGNQTCDGTATVSIGNNDYEIDLR